MTMQECYKAIGGNYEAVLGRLHSEALIQRFTLKFFEDQSYLQLKQALVCMRLVINPYRTRFIHRILSRLCRKKSISSNRTVA